MANVGLNGLIIGILLLGVLYAYRMVWRLFPEINWVNGFRVGQSSDENLAEPVLLAPMATLLGDRQERTVLSTNTMRSLLDSLASRLDESRDLMRYMVSLLIFLGLLGTFWGLLRNRDLGWRCHQEPGCGGWPIELHVRGIENRLAAAA